MSNPTQCALDADGNLLPASEITFYNDPDDITPISGPGAPSTSLVTSSSAPPTHPFFSGRMPAQVVAGSRRSSTRVSRPSARAADPDNAESLNISKRKATDAPTGTNARAQRARVHSHLVDPEQDIPDLIDTDTEDDGEPDTVDTEKEMEDAYTSTKAMGDADREAAHSHRKSERTNDIRTIFEEDNKHINPDTQKIEKGNWCTICKTSGKIALRHCFFTGNVTALRMHIARRSDHVKVYIERCEKFGIAMNNRVFSKVEADSSTNSLKQGTLDGIITSEPRQPSFTSTGLLDYIIELVVSEDEAFQLVDSGPFRRLLRYVRPALREKDIPHRSTLRKEIIERASSVEKQVKQKLAKIPGKISFTFDSWTSRTGDPYLSITGHYIETSPISQDWVLVCEQLGFEPIEGNHSGENMANILIRNIDRYGLREKVGWFTADNATNNDTAIAKLATVLDPSGLNWKPKQHRVRCMEHALHLAVGHFVKEIAPTSPQALTKKVKQALLDAGVDANEELDLIDEKLAGIDMNDDGESDNEEDISDALGKALALAKQIRMSPQARAFFEKCCKQVDVASPFALVMWVRTRWASLYHFLERFLHLQKGVDQFVRLADDSDKVPNLNGKSYADFRLDKKDWSTLKLIHEVIREPANAQQSFSSSTTPTVWRTIPVLEFLKQSWENMAENEKFSDLEAAISKGLRNIEKWYRKVDDTDVYFICLALDPNFKLAYTQEKWSPRAFGKGLERLGQVFDQYYIPPQEMSAAASAPVDKPTSSSVHGVQYGQSWMLSTVLARQQAEKILTSPRDELDAYLKAPLERVSDIIHWWSQHTVQYPTLSCIARDYLAIQGSATPSERAFSSGGLTGTALRNRLATEAFSSLQILKSAYRNGHIAASEQAQIHTARVTALKEELDM